MYEPINARHFPLMLFCIHVIYEEKSTPRALPSGRYLFITFASVSHFPFEQLITSNFSAFLCALMSSSFLPSDLKEYSSEHRSKHRS